MFYAFFPFCLLSFLVEISHALFSVSPMRKRSAWIYRNHLPVMRPFAHFHRNFLNKFSVEDVYHPAQKPCSDTFAQNYTSARFECSAFSMPYPPVVKKNSAERINSYRCTTNQSFKELLFCLSKRSEPRAYPSVSTLLFIPSSS